MRDYIEVNKDNVPCSFDILLGAEEFNMSFKYNSVIDLFTCTLSTKDRVLVYDEPLIYGVPLFKDVYDAEKFPCVNIVPCDCSGNADTVTYRNFGESVFLTIDDEG